MRGANIVFVFIVMQAAISFAADPILTEMVSGALGFGSPRFVEITNPGPDAIVNLSVYELCRATDDAWPDEAQCVLPAVELAAGASFTIAANARSGSDIESVFGFAPELIDGVANNSGYDPMALRLAGSLEVVDAYGQPAGGDASVYFYKSYACRKKDETEPSPVFSSARWTVGPECFLVGDTEDESIDLLIEYASPGAHGATPVEISEFLIE